MPSIYRQIRSPYWNIRVKIFGRWVRRSTAFPSDDAHADRAKRIAHDLEHAATIIERQPNSNDAAIAAALLSDWDLLPTDRQPSPSAETITIPAAYHLHPATQRSRDTTDGLRHARELDRWNRHALASNHDNRLASLTLGHVQAYLNHLRSQGLAYDSRRHALIPLRRACAMAPSYGLPNILAGYKLDVSRDRKPDIETLNLDQLRLILHHLEDPRARAAVALMACMGLRPSEARRARPQHIDGNILMVGLEQRKNAASRRDLPVAPTILEYLHASTNDQTTAPFLAGGSNRTRPDEAIHSTQLSRWVRRHIDNA